MTKVTNMSAKQRAATMASIRAQQDRRSPRARATDARQTARRTFDADSDELPLWKRQPGRYDVQGVDTRATATPAKETATRALPPCSPKKSDYKSSGSWEEFVKLNEPRITKHTADINEWAAGIKDKKNGEKLFKREIRQYKIELIELWSKTKPKPPAAKLKTTEEVQKWIEKKSGEYGNRNKFLSSDEYKAEYPKIKEIHAKAQNEFNKATTKATGLTTGDRAYYDAIVSPHGHIEELNGVVVNYRGIVQVKLDQKHNGKRYVPLHKGWQESKPSHKPPEAMSLSDVGARIAFMHTWFKRQGIDLRAMDKYSDEYKEHVEVFKKAYPLKKPSEPEPETSTKIITNNMPDGYEIRKWSYIDRAGKQTAHAVIFEGKPAFGQNKTFPTLPEARKAVKEHDSNEQSRKRNIADRKQFEEKGYIGKPLKKTHKIKKGSDVIGERPTGIVRNHLCTLWGQVHGDEQIGDFDTWISEQSDKTYPEAKADLLKRGARRETEMTHGEQARHEREQATKETEMSDKSCDFHSDECERGDIDDCRIACEECEDDESCITEKELAAAEKRKAAIPEGMVAQKSLTGTGGQMRFKTGEGKKTSKKAVKKTPKKKEKKGSGKLTTFGIEMPGMPTLGDY